MTDISKLRTRWATREKQPNRTALAVSAFVVSTVATVTVSLLPDRRQNELVRSRRAEVRHALCRLVALANGPRSAYTGKTAAFAVAQRLLRGGGGKILPRLSVGQPGHNRSPLAMRDSDEKLAPQRNPCPSISYGLGRDTYLSLPRPDCRATPSGRARGHETWTGHKSARSPTILP
jgi:hypothetical protein